MGIHLTTLAKVFGYYTGFRRAVQVLKNQRSLVLFHGTDLGFCFARSHRPRGRLGEINAW
jgi:hypothetical protein